MTKDETICYDNGQADADNDLRMEAEQASERAYEAEVEADELRAALDGVFAPTPETLAEIFRRAGLPTLDGFSVRWDAAEGALVAWTPDGREVRWT